jgi:hypothetical protein
VTRRHGGKAEKKKKQKAMNCEGAKDAKDILTIGILLPFALFAF